MNTCDAGVAQWQSTSLVMSCSKLGEKPGRLGAQWADSCTAPQKFKNGVYLGFISTSTGRKSHKLVWRSGSAIDS